VAYFFPESQLLFFFALGGFVLGELLPRDFALVEAREVFFARAEVEFDFFGGRGGELALFGGWAHDCRTCVAGESVAAAGYESELENCCRDLGRGRGWTLEGLAELTCA